MSFRPINLLRDDAAPPVQVFYVRTSVVSDVALAALLPLLSPSEHARAARYRFSVHRRQHVLQCALARLTLAHVAGGGARLARRLVLKAGVQGRPFVDGPEAVRRLDFNLSKTAGLIVCAISHGGTVGVDVENLSRPVDVFDVATVSLHDDERQWLATLDDESRRGAFLKLWTLKEAYTKARGLGLLLPVEQLAFDIADDEISARFGDAIDDDADAWRFHLLSPTHLHQVAVCVDGDQHKTPTLHDAAFLFAPSSRSTSMEGTAL